MRFHTFSYLVVMSPTTDLISLSTLRTIVTLPSANGRSRSATLLIAYLLSKDDALTLDDALARIRQGRPSAEPNPGFMSQLALYHTMGCPTDPALHPIYQRWLYQRNLEASLATGLAPSTIHFSDEGPPGSSPPTKSARAEAHADEPQTSSTLRCRRCRTSLATSMYLVSHAPAHPAGSTVSPCAHFFLEPMSWMRSELEQGKLEGRLECPKGTCGANVGKYAWQGMRCSCGVWVVPGISISKGRVDEIRGKGNRWGVVWEKYCEGKRC